MSEGPEGFWRGDARIAELEAQVEHLRKDRDHWKANCASEVAKKRNVSKMYGDLLRKVGGCLVDGCPHSDAPLASECMGSSSGESGGDRT